MRFAGEFLFIATRFAGKFLFIAMRFAGEFLFIAMGFAGEFLFIAMGFAGEFLFTWFSIQVAKMLSILYVIAGLASNDQLAPKGKHQHNFLSCLSKESAWVV